MATAALEATSRPRRTQQERRAGTRRALLEATSACLIAEGYAGTTTTAVCRRAGVSQGALFKHFSAKGLLLGAAAEHLFDQLTERFLARFAAIERSTNDPGERVDRAVQLLWEMFESDEFAASLELELAARTDPALRRVLGAVLTRHAERVRAQAAALFPTAGGEHYDRTLDLVLEVMVGMAVSRIADPEPEHYQRLLDHVCALARAALAPSDETDETDETKLDDSQPARIP